MIMDLKELNILKSVDGRKTHFAADRLRVSSKCVTIYIYINTVVIVALWCSKSGAYQQ